MGIMVEFVREEPSGMDRGQQISGEKGVWKVLGVEGIWGREGGSATRIDIKCVRGFREGLD